MGSLHGGECRQLHRKRRAALFGYPAAGPKYVNCRRPLSSLSAPTPRMFIPEGSWVRACLRRGCGAADTLNCPEAAKVLRGYPRHNHKGRPCGHGLRSCTCAPSSDLALRHNRPSLPCSPAFARRNDLCGIHGLIRAVLAKLLEFLNGHFDSYFHYDTSRHFLTALYRITV